MSEARWVKYLKLQAVRQTFVMLATMMLATRREHSILYSSVFSFQNPLVTILSLYIWKTISFC